MCPFFDDIEKLTNFKYTLPCVTRIGMEVSFFRRFFNVDGVFVNITFHFYSQFSISYFIL